MLVIPVFIPHQGCPHTCVFCNQFRISGREGRSPVTPARVQEIIRCWLSRGSRNRKEVQVAFYGGSFTGLPRERQRELFLAVRPFLESGEVHSIRLSTRPDYVDDSTVSFLRAHGVVLVELGVQSMDPGVLEAAGRGHSPEQASGAVRLLRAGNLRVGVQLMIGLPAETTASLARTAEEVTGLRPDLVRIYPVLVLKGSALADLYRRGEYQPLSLNKAVIRAGWLKRRFDRAGIPVVRMGLQPGSELEESLVAGPYHPAFGELVNSRLMLRRTRKLLAAARTNQVTLVINDRDLSVFRGIRRANMRRLDRLNLLDRFILRTDSSRPRQSVTVAG